MDLLREYVFEEKFEVDHRQPLAFQIMGEPWVVTGTIFMNPLFLLQFVILIGMLQMVISFCAVVAYYGIVAPKNNKKHAADMKTCLIGYGLLLPLLSYSPYYLIQSLDIRNSMLLINLVGVPVLIIFRLVEAMHEIPNLPQFAKQSLPGFVLYFGIPLVVDHDSHRPIKATREQFQNKLYKLLMLFVQTSLLFSLLTAYEYKIFPSSPENLFYWGNILNNFMAASVMSVTLDASCCTGEIALCMLTGGLHFPDTQLSPMTQATSISNFWGVRWNRLVGNSLRRGAYGPLKRVLPRYAASILTFLASGLVHEYMLFVLSTARDHGNHNNLLQQPYQHQLGNQFSFFLWNGVLLVLEKCLSKHKALVWMQDNVPRLVRTMLLLLLNLPILHLFTDEYDQSGIFRDAAMAFPTIQYLGNHNQTNMDTNKLTTMFTRASSATDEIIMPRVCSSTMQQQQSWSFCYSNITTYTNGTNYCSFYPTETTNTMDMLH